MQCISFLRQHTQSLTAAVLFLVCSAAAYADTYSGGVLTMPSLAIGSATYSTVVISPITLSDVLAYTVGGTPSGSEDSYDPASARLTIPTITVGGTTYTNVIVSVPSAVSVSIGSVSGVDSYIGTDLSIPRVQLSGTVYTDVVVAVAGIVSAGGGLPAGDWDLYDLKSRRLTIAAIEYRGKVYTNAVVTVATVVSGGGTGFTGYAYAVSSAAGLVAQFMVGLDGQLSALAKPTVTIPNSSPQSLAADATGSYVYVADSNSGAIYQYRVGANGALLPLTPAYISPGFTPSLIVANPKGPYLYAAAGASGIYQFNIGADGTLKPMSNPYAGGDTTEYSLNIDPHGNYLLVSGTEFGNPVESVHPIGADGVVMTPTLYASVSQVVAVLANATDTSLYQVTNSDIQQLSGDGDGNFSSAPDTPTPGNSALSGAMIDPSGKFFYVIGNVVSQFTIAAGGVLQAVSPATVTAGTSPAGFAFDPMDRFAYVSNLDGTVSQFAVGSSGALEPLNPASVPSPGPAQAIVVVPVHAL